MEASSYDLPGFLQFLTAREAVPLEEVREEAAEGRQQLASSCVAVQLLQGAGFGLN